MATVGAWHSINSKWYHICTNCDAGAKIEPKNRREGTGGKTLCIRCKRLLSSKRC